MPAEPRKDSVNPEEIEIHHVYSRCVQRAWLCGVDPLTGVDYSHRKLWIEGLLEYLASVFAVDVGGHHILSNHLHGIFRTRPDIAQTWSAEEVAWRWKLAWPDYHNGRWSREPTDEEIRELLRQGDERIAQIRKNLCGLSWFVARWKEPIAKMANAESDRRGHFFEQRFGNRRLATDEDVVTAFLYNDLQQVKAGIVDSVEASDFSSIQRQIRAEAAQAVEHFRGRRLADDEREAEVQRVEAIYANCFLAPIGDRGLLLTAPDSEPPRSELVLPDGYLVADASSVQPEAAASDTKPGSRPRRRRRSRNARAKKIHQRLQRLQRRRASRQSILGAPFPQYLDLVKRAAASLVGQRVAEDCSAAAPPGAASGRATSSSWIAEVRQFAAGLQEMARSLPSQLAQWLLPRPRGDP